VLGRDNAKKVNAQHVVFRQVSKVSRRVCDNIKNDDEIKPSVDPRGVAT
jgi:hypothetical protein